MAFGRRFGAPMGLSQNESLPLLPSCLDERIPSVNQRNAAAGQHVISALIYAPQCRRRNACLLECAFNAPVEISTTYNWQQDAANHDFDY